MVARINDLELEEELKAQRAASGADKWDEVWEGTYVMATLPNDEHQEIVGLLITVFGQVIQLPGLGRVRPGVNVSDRVDWKYNFRCPDVVVYLNETNAQNYDAFWLGGPDFGVEVVSPGDPTREKLPFYAKVGTRELLIVDRYPWQLELLRLSGDEMVSAGQSDVKAQQTITSEVIPFTFRLVSGKERPRIEVVHTSDQQSWTI